jgi:hypothetical protein
LWKFGWNDLHRDNFGASVRSVRRLPFREFDYHNLGQLTVIKESSNVFEFFLYLYSLSPRIATNSNTTWDLWPNAWECAGHNPTTMVAPQTSTTATTVLEIRPMAAAAGERWYYR